jgi:hypothetical protein
MKIDVMSEAMFVFKRKRLRPERLHAQTANRCCEAQRTNEAASLVEHALFNEDIAVAPAPSTWLNVARVGERRSFEN